MTNDEALDVAVRAYADFRSWSPTELENSAVRFGWEQAIAHLRETGQLCTTEERDRLQSAADQYRERLNVSEAALAKERGLTQSLGARCKELHEEAHRAARLWESAKNHSLHDIRTGMRRLREVLNRPNGARRAKGGSDVG